MYKTLRKFTFLAPAFARPSLRSPLSFSDNKDPRKILEQRYQDLKERIKNYQADFNKNPKEYRWHKFFAALYFVYLWHIYQNSRERAQQVTAEEALMQIKKGAVTEIHVCRPVPEKEEGDEEERNAARNSTFRKVYFKLEGETYYANVMEISLFYRRIRELEKNKSTKKVRIYEGEGRDLSQQLTRSASTSAKLILPILIPILLMTSSAGRMFKSVIQSNEGYRPDVLFKDIAGLGNAKIEISELVDFLKDPSKYKKIGAKVPKGALLAGPPGTGKTMMAKACAGEADVPFFSVSGSEFVELYAGMGATRVRQLFKDAKKKTPSIIFIDEIDAIGRKRGESFGGGHDERANTLNQLLVEMDGFGTADDIIILAATNRKEMLDNALTRPGRFDRIVEIELPDIRGRQEILEIYLNKLKLSGEQILEDYAKRLATLTYGFSGADLANLCNEAAILAVRNQKDKVQPVDFENASDRVLAGLEQNLNLEQEEKRKIAYHECGHAVVAWFSEGASPLLKISIVPRSKGSLGFAQYLPNQSTLMNREQIYDQLCVILGGRMAQQVFFNEGSSGAADDLQKVRNLAYAMVVKFGMSSIFPNYAPMETQGENIYSEQTSAKIDEEVSKVIAECTELTRKKVEQYRQKIELLAEAVLKKEVLVHEQIKEILGERPFEVKENYRQFLQKSEDAKRADIVV